MTDILTARLTALGVKLPEVEEYRELIHEAQFNRVAREAIVIAAQAALAAVVGELERAVEWNAALYDELHHIYSITQLNRTAAVLQRFNAGDEPKLLKQLRAALVASEQAGEKAEADRNSCAEAYENETNLRLKAEAEVARLDKAITLAYRLWLQRGFDDIGEYLAPFSTDLAGGHEAGGA